MNHEFHAAWELDFNGYGRNGFGLRTVDHRRNQRFESRMLSAGLPAFPEPRDQCLVVNPMVCGELGAAQPACVEGVKQGLLLLLGVAQPPASVGFENHFVGFIHIGHSNEIYDGYECAGAIADQWRLKPRLRLKTKVLTKTSHSHRQIADGILSQMAKQCGLTNKLFGDLIECPLSRDDYEEMLVQAGVVASQSG